MQQQLTVKPDYILQAQQEVIARQQQEIVMLKAAIAQLTDETPYREGSDPVADGSAG